MSDTLSLNKLEKIIELEATLREEYQQKLDEKDASIAALTQARSENSQLELKIKELESQLEQSQSSETDAVGEDQEAA